MMSLATPFAAAAQTPRIVVGDAVTEASTTRNADAHTRVHFRVVFRPDHAAELEVLLAAQRDPKSALFRRYLSTGEFTQRFAPTPQSVEEIVTYFGSFHVKVHYNTTSLVADAVGTASDVELLLHTDIRVSRHRGALLVATEPLTLPSPLAHLITGVVGLSRATRAHHHVGAAPRVSTSITSCSGASYASGLTAQEQGALYGIDQLWNNGVSGAGHTIALYELANYRTSDLTSFFSCYGINPTLSNTTIGSGASGFDAEVALDIQQAGVLAPGATLAIYTAPNDNTGPVDLFAKIANDNTSDVVSISWGICEAATDALAEAPIFQQMAAQGQSVIVATGDAGSSDCQPVDGTNTLSVDDPASQPYVTAVGGTHITSFEPFAERVWNDGSGASGGGVSSVFSRPSWQSAPGMDSGTMREIPDLSLTADPRVGFPTYYNGHWSTFGGTSIGAPILSGIIAVTAQSCSATRLGFLNPMLYSMARRGVGFRDVTVGSNDLFNAGGYSAGTGYDMATGLGSPDPTTFSAALCPTQPSPQTSTMSATSTTVDRSAVLDLALRDPAGVLLATTIPVVTATQSGATVSISVTPPVAADTTQRILVTTDRPGLIAVSVAVGGQTIASADVTVTSPLTARNVTSSVAALGASGVMRTSTLNGAIVIVGQRSSHQVVALSTTASRVRNFSALVKAPLASATPDVDCWRAVCSVTYRSTNKVIVLSNIWATKPKVLALPTAVGSASEPRIRVLSTGSVVSYTSSTGRLIVAMVSDAGTLLRTHATGTNIRGTPDLSRTSDGRARIIVRTTIGLSSYVSLTGTSLSAPSALLVRSGLTAGPLLLATSPDVIVATSGGQLVDRFGTAVTAAMSVTVPIRGGTTGMALLNTGDSLTVWCASPSWRSLDVAGLLGLPNVHATLSGTGDALLLTSGTTTWAFTR